MRRRLLLIAIGVALTSARPASAQYADTQDSTLRGLAKVYVKYTDLEGRLGPASGDIYNTLTLELRKAGLRIAKDSTDINPAQDAVLNVSTIVNAGALSTTVILRIDVEQQAQLVR